MTNILQSVTARPRPARNWMRCRLTESFVISVTFRLRFSALKQRRDGHRLRGTPAERCCGKKNPLSRTVNPCKRSVKNRPTAVFNDPNGRRCIEKRLVPMQCRSPSIGQRLADSIYPRRNYLLIALGIRQLLGILGLLISFYNRKSGLILRLDTDI
ncbi:hypothetical protein TcasGA2_TC000915 [Tribolium castaneum]|uniref:Uncharacterized protein n=1 Tax=Tribolium castaneum TaxID=7070 RepID=D6W934_TRICA|nr:hypothetical protein TcasGA2_TC000915 [Tribolium castaneum]